MQCIKRLSLIYAPQTSPQLEYTAAIHSANTNISMMAATASQHGIRINTTTLSQQNLRTTCQRGFAQISDATYHNEVAYTFYYHPDHLGSTAYMTDANGEVSSHLEYFAFGGTYIEESSAKYNSPYRYNGKELDAETKLYYYGARYYDPKASTWLSVDPLWEETMTPYQYVNNNPIKYIDPTGMKAETDFVDVDTGRRTHIEDGKDQVIVSDTELTNLMKGTFSSDRKSYDNAINGSEDSSLNTNFTSSQFSHLAQTVYAESSGGFEESLGIVNVLENRASNQGNSIMDQATDKAPYGIYGVREKQKFNTEKGALADAKRANVNRALAIGLVTDVDVSNGGTFWDGTDIKFNSHYKSWGVKFYDPSHNLWKQKDTSGKSQLITTGAVGKTIFTKFQNQGSRWYMSK